MPMTVSDQLAASSRDDGRIRPIPAVLVGVVLVFAFLLRFDAAVGRYGAAPETRQGRRSSSLTTRVAA